MADIFYVRFTKSALSSQRVVVSTYGMGMPPESPRDFVMTSVPLAAVAELSNDRPVYYILRRPFCKTLYEFIAAGIRHLGVDFLAILDDVCDVTRLCRIMLYGAECLTLVHACTVGLYADFLDSDFPQCIAARAAVRTIDLYSGAHQSTMERIYDTPALLPNLRCVRLYGDLYMHDGFIPIRARELVLRLDPWHRGSGVAVRALSDTVRRADIVELTCQESWLACFPFENENLRTLNWTDCRAGLPPSTFPRLTDLRFYGDASHIVPSRYPALEWVGFSTCSSEMYATILSQLPFLRALPHMPDGFQLDLPDGEGAALVARHAPHLIHDMAFYVASSPAFFCEWTPLLHAAFPKSVNRIAFAFLTGCARLVDTMSVAHFDPAALECVLRSLHSHRARPAADVVDSGDSSPEYAYTGPVDWDDQPDD